MRHDKTTGIRSDKYTLETDPMGHKILKKETTVDGYLLPQPVPVAKFFDAPLAEKVLSFLNETSRSKGVWPKTK